MQRIANLPNRGKRWKNDVDIISTINKGVSWFVLWLKKDYDMVNKKWLMYIYWIKNDLLN